MSTRVDESIEIARPAGEVARYVFDWRNDPEWIGGIEEARLVGDDGDGELRNGSQVERVASFLGKRIEYVLEVDELEPGALLAMRSVRGPFPMDVTYEVADAAAGARVRVLVEGDASGFYRLAGPLLNLQARRSIAGDLRRLKRLLESRPPAG